YTLTYSATDAACNTGSATRTVHVVDATAPVVTLNGTSPMTVECHASFIDLGATASDACDASVSATTPSGSVDPNTPGTYTLTYSATDAACNTGSATRTVHVVDATAPVVTLNGTSPMTVECHASFTDLGATASDACDASVSVTTPSGAVDPNTPGTYTLTYSATDAAGNTGTATRTVHVVDATAPVVTLNGTSPMTVECHASFTDLGATASDACDASVSVTTPSGAVDPNTPGTYTLTYSATDAAGNTGTATRTVHVVDATAPVVTLNGTSPMTVECHASFTDLGATAS